MRSNRDAGAFRLPSGDCGILEECRDKVGDPLWMLNLTMGGGVFEAAWMGRSRFEAEAVRQELEEEGVPVRVMPW